MARFIEGNFGIREGTLTFADARGVGDLREFFSLGNPPRTHTEDYEHRDNPDQTNSNKL